MTPHTPRSPSAANPADAADHASGSPPAADGETALAYIDTPAAAQQFLDRIAAVGRLAIDTEGASFHRFVDRIYLLQLTTAAGSAIIDPLAAGPLAGLGARLEDRTVEVVFHDADYDLRLLHQDYGWRVTNIFDTRIAAQLLGHRAFGLAALLEDAFGVRLDKKHQRADWSMRPLTPGMLEYAAQDTRYLLDLRDRLANELRRKGRLEWAQEEFQRLEGTQWAVEDPADGFLRLKGARDLTRRELAILRELVLWRAATAAAIDRATFRVVGNETLLEIARQAPTTRDALAAIRGMPRGMVDSRGAEVLGAVEHGLAVPDAALPRFPRAQRWERDADLDDRVARLKLARDAAAARLDLDPGLLCSRERLETIARHKPRTLDELRQVPGIRRWQVAELGPAFLAAMTSADSTATSSPAAADDSPYRPG